MDELREEVAASYRQLFWEARAFPPNTAVDIEAKFYQLTDQILTLIKEAGYVKLADNQELPENPYCYEDECSKHTGYSWAEQRMLEAGFRKIEL